MISFLPFRAPALALVAAFCVASAQAGVPVTEGFPGASDYSGPVTPVIPTAKTLILPITAYDPEGGRLSITATSSNPAIMVRVRTGNPLLQMTIHHDLNSSDSADVAYTGDTVFQLFRNLTPKTAGFVGGFAQAGFYDGLTFHRLADLNDPQDGTKSAVPSNIYQGGDPSGDGTGGPSFTYPNEQDPSLIFTGRGQLAMANSGAGSDFRGTNGSQFFITDGRITLDGSSKISKDGRPRFLDFGYTIFGQMTHGWDVLDSLGNTGRWPYPPKNSDGSAGTAPAGQTPDTPKVPVTINSAKVLDQYRVNGRTYTDAVLVLSAKAPGTGTITVTISDGGHPQNVISQSFQVEALDDTVNDKPIIVRMPDQVTGRNKQLDVLFQVIDLERDFVTTRSSVTNSTSGSNTTGFTQVFNTKVGKILAVLGNPSFPNATGPAGYVGPLDVSVAATEFDMTNRGSIDGTPSADDTAPVRVAVGEAAFTPEPIVVQGTAGTPLINVAVAKYQTGDTRAQTSDITAVINWGDGSVTTSVVNSTTTVTANFPAAGIVADGGSSGRFQVLGNHTYSRAGIYPVQVSFSDNTSNGQTDNGLNLKAISTAVITDGPLSAAGRTLETKSASTGTQTIATFTDSSTPGSYTAVIDWGDGLVTPGTIRATPGGVYTVSGAHTYQDPETFSVLVHVHKVGDTSNTNDVSAWSTVKATGFKGQQHLPPFDQAHLIAELTELVDKNTNQAIPTKSTETVKGVSQTRLAYELVVINNGNVASKHGHIRLYLSQDKKFNATAETNADNSINPADVPLMIGSSHTQADLPALPPGAGVTFMFRKTKQAGLDYRLSPTQLAPNGKLVIAPNSPFTGDPTSGNNVLALLDYDDPVADHEPIARAAVAGPVPGILLSGLLDSAPSLSTSEDSGGRNTHFSSFTVRLDRKPTANVAIAFTVSNTAEGSVSLTKPPDPPAPSGGSSSVTVTITPANWASPQTVYVIGVADSSTDGAKSFSVTGSVTSDDLYFNGMPVASVNVSNQDSVFVVTPISLTAYRDPSVPRTAVFTVALVNKPFGNVTLPISSSDEASGVPDKTSLTFTPTNGTTAQTVTVTALDTNATGDKAYQILLGPASSRTADGKTVLDSRYDGVTPGAVTVTNKDDPFIVTPANLTIYRSANQSTFTVALAKAPTATVIIPVTASQGAPGTVTPNFLVFTSTNYSTPQTVTVTATDSTATTDASYSITLGNVQSSDTNYNAAVVPPVQIVNTSIPIAVSQHNLVLTEAPGGLHSRTFTVALLKAPTDTVSFTVAAGTHANVDKNALLFTPGNYSTPQTVTVTAIDDNAAAGNISYQVVFGQVQSNDPSFSGVTPSAISATNLDAGVDQ